MLRTHSTQHTNRWLYLFLAVHLLLWTLVPAMVRYNLPLDAIEGTIWGHQLEFGYDKNPWLNGWLSAFVMYLNDESAWMIYLLSQVSVIACMWCMYQLAKKILSPLYALVSVMLLECLQYFNFHAIDFNDNTLELGLWGISIYAFYLALRSNKFSYWILTGIFTALGMMAKYYTIVLIAGMFLFLIFNTKNRQQLKTFPPFAGLLIFTLICLPHIFWLFSHDFISIRYVVDRGSSIVPHWSNHFIYPAKFFWQQLQVFLPAIIPCIILMIGKKPLLNPQRIKIDSFNKQFLFYVAIMPMLLTLLISFILGTTLRAGWGMPLLSAWGIILISCIQPNITRARLTAFVIFIFSLMIAEISGYSYSLMNPSSTSSANFPGREIATALTKEWREKYNTKLEYVGGSRWIGGNIAFYSKDHPAVFIELDKKRAPWINANDLQKKGGILVWEMSQWNDLPEQVKEKFLAYPNLETREFSWYRNKKNHAPIKIGVVILPPAKV